MALDNRWVIMAKMIPWSEFDGEYAAIFSEKIGAPAKTFRMALGALIIKEKLGISDREKEDQLFKKEQKLLNNNCNISKEIYLISSN